jgi:group II intron reverse transcriptase/maturase
MVQKSKQLELPFERRGEAPRVERSGQATSATTGTEGPGTDALMERVLEHTNLKRALKRVRGNKGSPGIDGMTADELPEWLKEHWPRVREELLAGTYQPHAVRRVMIPKPGGGERMLGIPTVLDRLIQQALLQVLQPPFDATFSEHSHGFRPGRGAHGAMREVCAIVEGGKSWVVDVDLEKFFDRVNHDVLMGKLAKRIADRRVLRLIRRYLNAGVMADGIVVERHEGTPQGGPLSPLLANVLLDDVDKELEKRGHAFVRYADDLRVFVRTERSGERVMRTLGKLFGQLHLRINEAKSAVARVASRPFLGFTPWMGRDGKTKLRVAPKALHTMKDRVRELTRRTRGRSLAEVVQSLAVYLRGWLGYFRVASMKKRFGQLDEWIRHRLRAYQLKQWRHGSTVYRELRVRGLSVNAAKKVAGNARRWWRNSAMAINAAIPIAFFDGLGLPRLAP